MPATITIKRHRTHDATPYERLSTNYPQLEQKSGILHRAISSIHSAVTWALGPAEEKPSSQDYGHAAGLEHRRRPKQISASQETITGRTGDRQILSSQLVPHYFGRPPQATKKRDSNLLNKVSNPELLAKGVLYEATANVPVAQGDLVSTTRAPPDGNIRKMNVSAHGKLGNIVPCSVRATGHTTEIVNWLSTQEVRSRDLGTIGNASSSEVHRRHQWRQNVFNIRPPHSRTFPASETDGRAGSLGGRDQLEGQQYNVFHASNKSISPDLDLNFTSTSLSTKTDGHTDMFVDIPEHSSSSSGIISAWREICRRQESLSRNATLGPFATHETRAGSPVIVEQVSAISPDGISTTNVSSIIQDKPGRQVAQDGGTSLTPRETVDEISLAPSFKSSYMQSHEKLTGGLRVEPLLRATRTSLEYVSPGLFKQNVRTSKRSLVGRETRERNSKKVLRNTDNRTPKPTVRPKAKMVSAEVQTYEALPSVGTGSQGAEFELVPPTIERDRRKRPGCFSALNEDLEEFFGPYSDVPSKRSRLGYDCENTDAEESVILRPRMPLLNVNNEVRSHRHELQQVDLVTSPLCSQTTALDEFQSFAPEYVSNFKLTGSKQSKGGVDRIPEKDLTRSTSSSRTADDFSLGRPGSVAAEMTRLQGNVHDSRRLTVGIPTTSVPEDGQCERKSEPADTMDRKIELGIITDSVKEDLEIKKSVQEPESDPRVTRSGVSQHITSGLPGNHKDGNYVLTTPLFKEYEPVSSEVSSISKFDTRTLSAPVSTSLVASIGEPSSKSQPASHSGTVPVPSFTRNVWDRESAPVFNFSATKLPSSTSDSTATFLSQGDQYEPVPEMNKDFTQFQHAFPMASTQVSSNNQKQQTKAVGDNGIGADATLPSSSSEQLPNVSSFQFMTAGSGPKPMFDFSVASPSSVPSNQLGGQNNSLPFGQSHGNLQVSSTRDGPLVNTLTTNRQAYNTMINLDRPPDLPTSSSAQIAVPKQYFGLSGRTTGGAVKQPVFGADVVPDSTGSDAVDSRIRPATGFSFGSSTQDSSAFNLSNGTNPTVPTSFAFNSPVTSPPFSFAPTAPAFSNTGSLSFGFPSTSTLTSFSQSDPSVSGALNPFQFDAGGTAPSQPAIGQRKFAAPRSRRRGTGR